MTRVEAVDGAGGEGWGREPGWQVRIQKDSGLGIGWFIGSLTKTGKTRDIEQV